MLKEFVDRIADLAAKAATPKEIKVGGPDHIHTFLTADNTTVTVTADPEIRDHAAQDIATIAKFYTHAMQPDETGFPEVWFSREGIKCFIDGDTRRDNVEITLEYSPQFKTILSLGAGDKPKDQKSFIRLLRIDLCGCNTGPLLDAVRNVRFTAGSQSEGSIVHGKQSLGKSVQAQLENAAGVPDAVTLSVPVFDGFITGMPFSVPCAVEVDATACTFTLIPFPGAIETALRAAEATIGDLLASALGETDRLYYGRP